MHFACCRRVKHSGIHALHEQRHSVSSPEAECWQHQHLVSSPETECWQHQHLVSSPETECWQHQHLVSSPETECWQHQHLVSSRETECWQHQHSVPMKQNAGSPSVSLATLMLSKNSLDVCFLLLLPSVLPLPAYLWDCRCLTRCGHCCLVLSQAVLPAYLWDCRCLTRCGHCCLVLSQPVPCLPVGLQVLDQVWTLLSSSFPGCPACLPVGLQVLDQVWTLLSSSFSSCLLPTCGTAGAWLGVDIAV